MATKRKTKNLPATPDVAEIATALRDVINPAYGGTLKSRDDTLLSRGQGKGLKIYDDLERDPHAYAVLQKRKLAVVSREWRVDPASEDKLDIEAAELVRRHLKDMPFDRICLDFLDATLKGYAVGEVMWEIREDGEWYIKDVLARDQRRFVFSNDGTLKLLTPTARSEGEEVPERKFICHRWGAKNGDPYGLGLGTRLFWLVFFKRNGITFWLNFIERYGTPTAVAKYPRGASKAEQDLLLRAIRAMQRDAGIVVPEDVLIDFLEAQRYSSSNVHETMVRWCDEQISVTVLGETLTTNIEGEGSRSAAETHNSVRLEISKADADILSATINSTLIKWIVELNLPGARPPQVWRVFDAKEDLDKRSLRDKILLDAGYHPQDPSYFNETYGGNWVYKGSSQTDKPDTNFAEPVETPAQDSLDDLREAMIAEWQESGSDFLKPIMEAIEAATSYEDLKVRLNNVPSKIRDQFLVDVLARGNFVAKLAGDAGVSISDVKDNT
ncbi:MAG: DUF935 family protein [Alphaproteobacteria bacterium]